MSRFEEIVEHCSEEGFQYLNSSFSEYNKQLNPLFSLIKTKRMMNKIFILSSLLDIKQEIKQKHLYYTSGETRIQYVLKDKNKPREKVSKNFNTVDSFMRSLGCDKKIAKFLGEHFFHDIFNRPLLRLCCIGFEEGELLNSFNILAFQTDLLINLPIISKFIMEGKTVQTSDEFVYDMYHSDLDDFGFHTIVTQYIPILPPDPDDIEPLSWWKRSFS